MKKIDTEKSKRKVPFSVERMKSVQRQIKDKSEMQSSEHTQKNFIVVITQLWRVPKKVNKYTLTGIDSTEQNKQTNKKFLGFNHCSDLFRFVSEEWVRILITVLWVHHCVEEYRITLGDEISNCWMDMFPLLSWNQTETTSTNKLKRVTTLMKWFNVVITTTTVPIDSGHCWKRSEVKKWRLERTQSCFDGCRFHSWDLTQRTLTFNTKRVRNQQFY